MLVEVYNIDESGNYEVVAPAGATMETAWLTVSWRTTRLSMICSILSTAARYEDFRTAYSSKHSIGAGLTSVRVLI
ncbi:MAG: hypothetical protein PHH90_09960 [Limnochordia bacterium]|nr:hypothetical protein [Limnochordia bacterium]